MKAARQKKEVTKRGTPIKPSMGFSTETFQARRELDDIFKILNKKYCQTRILYSAKLSRNGADFSTQSKAERVHHH